MILAATAWPTNAELIRDVAALGYLRKEWRTLDPTFGNGIWWQLWRPDDLVVNSGLEDFRGMSYADAEFDAIAFDPPYVAKGGRKTSGIRAMDDRYGQHDCPATPKLLQELINAGLDEMHRLVRPGGIVLVKCQDYVSSGKLWLGTHLTLSHALSLGFRVEDRLEHVSGTGPERWPHQVHARRNLSTLFVLRRPPKPGVPRVT